MNNQKITPERIARARSLLARLCERGLVSMSVPPDWNRDEDLLLSDIIRDSERHMEETKGFRHMGTTFSSDGQILMRVYGKVDAGFPEPATPTQVAPKDGEAHEALRQALGEVLSSTLVGMCEDDVAPDWCDSRHIDEVLDELMPVIRIHVDSQMADPARIAPAAKLGEPAKGDVK